ncbi:major facilitator superfamily domain-containing protein 6-A isoform X2 [Folsomia candida]|nr:major facilitator superfamily domain-containing protein 6-A isoform X2 [Folsomia candida]
MVLVLATVANGLFHSLLLAVPTYHEVPLTAPFYLTWTDATGTGLFLPGVTDSTKCDEILGALQRDYSHPDIHSGNDDLGNNVPFNFKVTLPCSSSGDLSCSSNDTSFANDPQQYGHFHCNNYQFTKNNVDATGCQIWIDGSCLVRSNVSIRSDVLYETNVTVPTGNVEIRGNNSVTFWSYFSLRVLATLFMNSCFSLLDATTLAIIKTVGEAEYGKERIFSVLGFGIVSPIAGLLVDYVSRLRGFTDYSAAFYLSNVLLGLNVITYFVMKLHVEKPDAGFMKNVRSLLSYPEVVVFLFMIFILGTMWGFVESYLFIFLKELDAPNYLLGLTLTVGSFVGIPFSYGSERILNFFGRVNIMVFAFIAYFFRFFGYSYITSPFFCFPYEAMEAFTYHLMWIAAATYCSDLAPKGLLATLTGVMGSLHYGLGKGNGAFIGGYLIGAVGTRLSFRWFGLFAGAVGLIYFIINLLWLEKVVQKRHQKLTMKNEEEDPMEKDALVTERGPPLTILYNTNQDKVMVKNSNAENDAEVDVGRGEKSHTTNSSNSLSKQEGSATNL